MFYLPSPSEPIDLKRLKIKKNKKISIRSKFLVISLIDINYLLVNDKYIKWSRNHFLHILWHGYWKHFDQESKI